MSEPNQESAESNASESWRYAAPQRSLPEEPAPRGDGPRQWQAGDLVEQLNPAASGPRPKSLRARMGLGPTREEREAQGLSQIAATPFDRPVTVMIANPKGGVGKTPTTLLLAAALGVARGGGVVAWDNNELRGTMPDRSFSAHRRHVRDVLEHAESLRAPHSQFTDLAHFLNHQQTGKFHTLGSAQTSGHVISRIDFELIHDVLARYFQVIVVDTGNNEASPNWLAAARAADCLVVPTKWRKDSLIPAARMLETLEEERPDLLERTVVVATNGPSDAQRDMQRSGQQYFGSRLPVVEVPTDAHIAAGGVIDYAELEPATQRAGLRLAAAVAERIALVAGLEE